MLQVVEWGSYTFRSYRDQCRTNVEKLRESLETAERELAEAEEEFEVMKGRGMADSSLPSNFGQVLLARMYRNGQLPVGTEVLPAEARRLVGQNIERLSVEMGEA